MEIKNYKSGDENEILNLFKKVFKKEMAYNYWDWRFKNNPANIFMIKLMWDEETLVGHYAASPVPLLIEDQEALGALSMTTMTDPSYGGQGIFPKLAEALYRDMFNDHGARLVYGFPNNNSHYSFKKKLGWADLSIIPTLVLPVSKVKTSNSEDITVSRLNKNDNYFKARHQKTYNQLSENYKIKINKTPEFLNWRFTDNPENVYDVFEYELDDKAYFAVVKLFRSFGNGEIYEADIVEINFPNDHNIMNNLLSCITSHYSSRNLSAINTWLPLTDDRHLLLERIGFTNEVPLSYFGQRFFDTDRSNLLDNDRCWFYSMSDSDLF